MSTTMPAGLGKSGRELYRSMSAAYVLDPGEESILLAAANSADELDRLRGELAKAAVVVVGSTGQPRPNPLLAEIRAHQAAMAALIKQLTPLIASGSESVSDAARAAASARWHRPKVVGGVR